MQHDHSSALMGSHSSNAYRREYTDELVAELDELIDWQSRVRSEGTFLIDRLQEAGVQRVLDAACGTGFHVVQLAAAGFSVIASDGAPAMVKRANENFRRHELAIKAHVCDWRDLDGWSGAPFDAILCLGNSFSHIFEAPTRTAVLSHFNAVLRPGGLAIVDHRNYEALQSSANCYGPRRQSYCCCAPDTTVWLEPLSGELVRIHYQLRGEEIYQLDTFPLSRVTLARELTEAGFEDVVSYRDGVGSRGDDLVEFWIHVARKTSQMSSHALKVQ